MNFRKLFVTISWRTMVWLPIAKAIGWRTMVWLPITKAIGLAVLILVVFAPGFLKVRELKNRNMDLTQKNRRLEAENSMLKIELQRVDKDQVYQEKILREKMGVVRKNEVPVKIVPQD